MRDDAPDLDSFDDGFAPESSIPELARERAARRAVTAVPEARTEPRHHDGRGRVDLGEAGGIVRVEVVSERHLQSTPARPLVLVQVELPPTDPAPRPAPSLTRELRLQPPPLEVAPEECARLALQPASRSPEQQGAQRRQAAGESKLPLAVAAPRPPRRIRRMALPIAIGKSCPRCGEQTYRERAPWYLRPLRWLMLNTGSYRRCAAYHWSGLALHR